MHRPFVAYDGIALAELIFYILALSCAVSLCRKHGFTKEAGWRGLIILSLARIIGGTLRLATVTQPTDVNLYIGWMTLNGIGLAPLILLTLGLISRVFASMSRQGRVVVRSQHQRAIEVVLLVAIVLLIVGGTRSRFTIEDGQPKVHYSALSRVAVALLVVVLGVICIEVALALRNQGYVAQGEHRIVLVVVVCLPFIVVRLTYSCLLIIGGVTSTPWLYLGLSSLMEMVVTLLGTALGFSLDRDTKRTAYWPRQRDDSTNDGVFHQ